MRLRLWTKLFPPGFLLLLFSRVLLLKNALLLKVPSHHKESAEPESGGSEDSGNTQSQDEGRAASGWKEVTLRLDTQPCLTLLGPPGSVRGMLQAGILEWGAISSSRGPSQPSDRTRPPALPPLPSEHQGCPRSHSILLITKKRGKIL